MKKLALSVQAKKIRSKPGQIRIIGGKWRGRKFPVLNSLGLRPTIDRVRETLFNWLAQVIRGARCLDCFAGSGALGLEALSRYASNVALLEHKCPVVKQLKKNLALLQGHGEVIHTNTLTWLSGNGKPFNIVFLDPPFRKGLLTKAVILLEKQGWLSDKSWIYLESESKSPEIRVPDNWKLHREKVSGQVAYRLYIRSKEKPNAD